MFEASTAVPISAAVPRFGKFGSPAICSSSSHCWAVSPSSRARTFAVAGEVVGEIEQGEDEGLLGRLGDSTRSLGIGLAILDVAADRVITPR